MAELTEYDKLCAYTLNLGDLEFSHQHVVDAYAAQTATVDDKPIRLFFALVGLFLHCEIGRTGLEVQRAHMKLAATRQIWPTFEIPSKRGDLGPADVMAEQPGESRQMLIDRWAEAVWAAYRDQRDKVTLPLVGAEIIGEM